MKSLLVYTCDERSIGGRKKIRNKNRMCWGKQVSVRGCRRFKIAEVSDRWVCGSCSVFLVLLLTLNIKGCAVRVGQMYHKHIRTRTECDSFKNGPVTRWIHNIYNTFLWLKILFKNVKYKRLKSQRFGSTFSLHQGEVIRKFHKWRVVHAM